MAAAEIQGFEANAEHYLDVKALEQLSASKQMPLVASEASRKDKGRDTFGCPTFLRPLPKYLLAQLRQVEDSADRGGSVFALLHAGKTGQDASPDSKRIDARGLGLLRPGEK